MKRQKLQQNLIAALGAERVRENEPLVRHCNWRVGGPGDLFVAVKTADELVTAARAARQLAQPLTILGFGANVLVSDKGIRGLVILNRAHGIRFHDHRVVEADSGTNLAVLAKAAAERGVAGLEFLIGIPGTVGAAMALNAGTRTRWISTIVDKAQILTRDGELSWLCNEELGFSYRHSKIKETGEIVIRALLHGEPDESSQIEKRMREELRVRKTQPTGPSAGSVFTNPPDDYAGRLIEAAGLKGFRIGDAQVSTMHANFILNAGKATAQDIRSVIEHVKKAVHEKFGVQLQEEIRYLGEW